MNVVSLKDYAAQKNISYEAVRQQVVRYKDELGSHVIRDGRQQFLDEEAVAFLDAKRQKNPVAIIQQSKDEAIEDLRNERERLLHKIAAQADEIAKLAQWKADNAMLIAVAEQNKMLLDNAQRDVKLLEGFVANAKAEIVTLTAEKAREEEIASEARENAQKAIEDFQEASERAQRAEKRNRLLEEYAEACRAYNELPSWRRVFTKPPVVPELQEG